MPDTIWDQELIQQGIERYFTEFGTYPTAVDFDEYPYLPSARQIQRRFGGMQKLRETLGYEATNYTKGDARQKVYSSFSARSINAEDMLEIELIKHFGEPYVHTQKRYYQQLKNRWDFFVYYKNGYMGIDIFSTSRKSYILRNVHHKLHKYKNVPASIPIYFVVENSSLTTDDVESAIFLSDLLRLQPNIHVLTLADFIGKVIPPMQALELPIDVKLVLPFSKE